MPTYSSLTSYCNLYVTSEKFGTSFDSVPDNAKLFIDAVAEFISFVVAAFTISAITNDNKRTPTKAETYLCSFTKFNILILVIINQSLILVLVATFMIKYLHFIVYILI